jgi:hypothetical protein
MNGHRVAVLAALLTCFGCGGADGPGSDSANQEESAKTEAVARFQPYTQTLRDGLTAGGDVDAAVSQLMGARPAAFSLQALCRLYAPDGGDGDPGYRSFEEWKSAFKAIEDAIGQIDKWQSIVDDAQSQLDSATTPEEKQHAEEVLKQAQDTLAGKFDAFKAELASDAERWRSSDGTESPRLDEFDEFLADFHWKTRAGDRGVILDSMLAEFADLSEGYDMTQLEGGLHELRRDLRWPLIEQKALNGMITVKSSCSVDNEQIKNAPSDGRYDVLPEAREGTCQLDKCIVSAAANYVERFGNLKDEIEVYINTHGGGDSVPDQFRADAQAIYDDLESSGLIDVYAEQLKACSEEL